MLLLFVRDDILSELVVDTTNVTFNISVSSVT